MFGQVRFEGFTLPRMLFGSLDQQRLQAFLALDLRRVQAAQLIDRLRVRRQVLLDDQPLLLRLLALAVQLGSGVRDQLSMTGEIILESRDHLPLFLPLARSFLAHYGELALHGSELNLQVLDQHVLFAAQVHDLGQGSPVSSQVSLQAVDHLLQALPLGFDDVALGVKAQELSQQVSWGLGGLVLERALGEKRVGIGQDGATEGGDDRVPVDRRFVIVGMDQLVVEAMQMTRNSAQGGVAVHVHREHHQRKPARQAGVADADEIAPEAGQVALHLPAHG